MLRALFIRRAFILQLLIAYYVLLITPDTVIMRRRIVVSDTRPDIAGASTRFDGAAEGVVFFCHIAENHYARRQVSAIRLAWNWFASYGLDIARLVWHCRAAVDPIIHALLLHDTRRGESRRCRSGHFAENPSLEGGPKNCYRESFIFMFVSSRCRPPHLSRCTCAGADGKKRKGNALSIAPGAQKAA